MTIHADAPEHGHNTAVSFYELWKADGLPTSGLLPPTPPRLKQPLSPQPESFDLPSNEIQWSLPVVGYTVLAHSILGWISWRHPDMPRSEQLVRPRSFIVISSILTFFPLVLRLVVTSVLMHRPWHTLQTSIACRRACCLGELPR